MSSFNQVILMGNLTRDPEVAYTPKGTAVAKLGLAVNRKWKTEEGESKEEVTFVDCEAWGKTAETLGQYMKKGSPIFVLGRLKLDQWDDKETGQKRSKLKVQIVSFQFMGGKADGDRADQPHASDEREAQQTESRRSSGSGAPKESQEAPAEPGDDQIPF